MTETRITSFIEEGNVFFRLEFSIPKPPFNRECVTGFLLLNSDELRELHNQIEDFDRHLITREYEKLSDRKFDLKNFNK